MNPWFGIARDSMRLSIDAQNVVALRLFRLAHGGEAARTEARRMVSEKADALVQVQFAAAKSIASGKHGPALVRETIGIYGRRVRHNRRRLSGGWWSWW